MDNERKSRILSFVRNQLTQSETLLKTLTFDLQGRKLAYRNVYTTLNAYMQNFAEKKGEPRWLAIAGLLASEVLKKRGSRPLFALRGLGGIKMLRGSARMTGCLSQCLFSVFSSPVSS